MKKILIVFFIFINVCARPQKMAIVKASGPCMQAMVDTIKGYWINPVRSNKIDAEQVRRFNVIQEIMLGSYPNPTGAVAAWGGTFQNNPFANKIKFVKNQWGTINEEPITNYRFSSMWYHVIVYPYFCAGKNEIRNIYPEITGGVGLGIEANRLYIASQTSQVRQDEILIDGHPILLMYPVATNWKGHELLCSGCGPNLPQPSKYYLLIHRPGELPYIPVTRKQYLERAILYFTKFYDNAIEEFDKVATSQLDDEERAKTRKETAKEKEETLRWYNDEFAKSSRNNLLDSPAVVRSIFEVPYNEGVIFTSESEGGYRLVIENENYMRKDLPKYAPQFLVVSWSWNKNAYGQLFKNAIEDNFPFEKLQAMIDK
jgi:hypothetical protein